ncbi:MAG: hypothetical protein LC676_10700 [Loktanella sp.]|nr:hypothetical protein [Loktanella sp.]
MTNIFGDMQAIIDGAFAETGVITPREREQYTSGANDSVRPGATVFGVYTSTPGSEGVGGPSSKERDGVTALTSEAGEFWITAARAAALGYEIKRGDRIQLTDRAGAPKYTIAAIQDTSQGDRNLLLIKEHGT